MGVRVEDVQAYNLTVADLHTYYAGDEPILVHDADCGRTVLHRPDSLRGTNSYECWSAQSNDDILRSLRPGADSPLVVNQRATIMDGNTRALILQERGVDLDDLPAVTIRSGHLHDAFD